MTRPTSLEVADHYEPPTSRDFVERVVTTTLNYVQRPQMHVSVLLADDREVARLHADYLDDPSVTDVITFVLEEDHVELAISVERARAVASERGHAAEAELALYIVHGILHASGYDDIEVDDRQRMRVAEQAVLEQLGLSVSAVDEVE